MNKDAKILIVGHNDIIENSLKKYFDAHNYSNVFSSFLTGLNPVIQPAVYDFFAQNRPEYVFLASTRSGGIEANRRLAGEFIYHNLESQNNILYASYKFGVKKLVFVASSCVYPKECPQPIKEEYLLTGELEKTSEAYAVAKIAGIKLCEAFRKQYGLNAITVIPATVYGPGSGTDIETAHVIGALMAKFACAVAENKKEVIVWGTGNPRREFLFADDFIEACIFLMDRYEGEELINVGSGYDVSIKELAEMIAQSAGFKGNIIFDQTKPDGVKQKLLDNSRITKLGWRPKIVLKEGIEKTYRG